MRSTSRTPPKALHAAGFLARSITRGDFMENARRGAPRVARRMTHRVRLLIGVALLPLALFAFLPLVSSGQQKNLRLQDRAQEGPDRLAQGPRAGAVLRRRRLHAQDQRAAGRHHGAADQAGAPAGEPGPQARRARPHPGGPAPRAAAARPAARPAGRGARGALQAARRALQGRPARPRDRRARVQRVRRPARAHGVHAARLRPGRAHHRRRRDGEGRRHGDREAARQAREAREGHRERDRGRGRPGR